jgi:hypothetical protein
MICGYGLLASILVLRLVFGGAVALPTGSQTVTSPHPAPHMLAASAPALPTKFVAASWTGHTETPAVRQY